MISKLAMQTIVLVTALCIRAGSGFMTQDMVQRMMNAGRPPLRPQVQGRVSPRCEAALGEMIAESIQLLTVVDSIGKPQAGLLQGNFAWLGHFDECRSVTDFNYCLATLKLDLPLNSSIINALGSGLLWGLCVPDSCSEDDIVYSLQDFLELVEAPFNVSVVSASSVTCARDPPVPYSTGFIVTILILGAIGSLMILGAFLDKTLRSIDYKPPALTTSGQLPINRPVRFVDTGPYQRVTNPSREGDEEIVAEPQEIEQELEEIPTGMMGVDQSSMKPNNDYACTRAWHQFVLSFAINRNLSKLLSARTAEGSISCLNGIRVISMTWVILGHVIAFSVGSGIIGNPLFAAGWLQQLGFQAVSNAFYSVDTFFYLSGLLVAYMALGRMKKTDGKLPWLWFYFHRYWRLTPALGMTMLISLYLRPYVGSSPVWQLHVRDPYCEQYWWANLLYVNNLVTNGGLCISWVWYLANDMQFFVISPFILIMLYKKPILGLVSMGVMCLACIVTTGILMVKYNFSAVILGGGNADQDPHHSFMNVIYNKPYCRIAPYLVGMAMGYFLHLYKNRQFKVHPVINILGWCGAAAIGAYLVYGLYPNFHGHPFSTIENAVYMSLCRFAWSISLSWVVFACHYGYGGWINDFLSWELWVPMSRLTYSAYLLHPIIIMSYSLNYLNNYFYSLYTLAFEVPAIIALAYTAAIAMAVSLEFPLGNLEKMFMPLGEKKTK